MNKGYTALQLIFTVAIILVLASISLLSYQKILEMSREKVCATNQQALTNAVEAYISTNYVIPAVLGDLKLKHLEKGYAQVMEEADWFTTFSYFVVKTSMSNEAYAQFLTYENLKNYGVGKDFFRCPSDSNGGTSYGINSNIAGKYWYEIDDNLIIVGDCDNPTFSSQGDLRERHSQVRYRGSAGIAREWQKGGVNPWAGVRVGEAPHPGPRWELNMGGGPRQTIFYIQGNHG